MTQPYDSATYLNAQTTSSHGTSMRGRSVLAVGAISLLISACLRLTLEWSFGNALEVPWTALPSLLIRGLLHDFVVLPAVLLPLGFLVFASPHRLMRSRVGTVLGTAVFFATIFGLIYLGFVEYYFFDEFSSRMNLVAVDYLVSSTEVMVNIWDSYPVIPTLAFTALAASVAMYLIRRPILSDLGTSSSSRTRLTWVTTHVILAIAMPAMVPMSSLSSESRYADQISFNGLHSFIVALRTNEISYPDYYRTIPEANAFALARHELIRGHDHWVSHRPADLRREHDPTRGGLVGHNVVVIVEESLGCEHVGACGDTRQLTPNVDALARDAILWSNAWATGTRTVRGLEAIVTSFPPIPSKSIVKRPGSEHIATWGQVMDRAGYHVSFLYGGYGTFDNMNHFFGSNGFEVSDRRDIPDPMYANIWGVSDEDLFRHALAYFDERSTDPTPFFSVVLTTSNHKPFTFREGVPGVPAEGGGRLAGVRYADYALGYFFREARDRAWFDNTIFVVLGDHGSRVYGHGEIPLPTYRIPVLVFGKGVEAEVLSTPTSQIDVAPTILGLLGIEYTAPFFGRDVLADRDPERPIYVSHNHDVGMLVGNRLAVLGLQKTSAVFSYDAATDRQLPLPYDRAIVDRATAVYESAFLVFSRGLYQ